MNEPNLTEIKTEPTTKLKLFLFFLKVGATTFGGGYALISQLQSELIEKKKWVTADEMMDMLAIGESTPGPFAINTATFIGYKLQGFWGALLCTLGFVLPSFLMITLISFFLEAFLANRVLSWIFHGIRAGVIMMIGLAFIRFMGKMEKNPVNWILFAGAFLALLFFKVNLIYLILMGALIGLVRSALTQRRTK